MGELGWGGVFNSAISACSQRFREGEGGGGVFNSAISACTQRFREGRGGGGGSIELFQLAHKGFRGVAGGGGEGGVGGSGGDGAGLELELHLSLNTQVSRTIQKQLLRKRLAVFRPGPPFCIGFLSLFRTCSKRNYANNTAVICTRSGAGCMARALKASPPRCLGPHPDLTETRLLEYSLLSAIFLARRGNRGK